MKTGPRTYLIALAITVLIFITAIFATNQISSARFTQLRGIEERISIDILSLETQFDLLAQVSCEDLGESRFLSRELGTLGDRLATTESRLGTNNEEVLQLKKQYSLLQIKDSLLLQRVSEQCETDVVPIMYFYANECSECTRAGFALSVLRNEYPSLRVYSFDYNLDLSALRTLTSIYNIQREELPVFIIDGEKVYGFSSLEELTAELPESVTTIATSTATTTEE